MRTAKILTLAFALTFALAACGGGGDAPNGDTNTPAPSPTQGGTTSPSPDPTPDNGGDTTPSTPDPTPPPKTATVGGTLEFGGCEWRVLEVSGGKALLLSENVFDSRPFNEEWGVYVTWEECDLRSYLNGEFYNSFDTADRAKIALTAVTNEGNPWDGTPGGDDTDDYIFLLSIAEVVGYFGDSGQLDDRPVYPGTPSGFAGWISDEFNEARSGWHEGIGWHDYLLRSPCNGVEYTGVSFVDSYGSIQVIGEPPYQERGVRPAMWVSLD
jgi:hypothetical protein